MILELFGRHVRGGAEHRAGQRQRRLVDQARDAEVREACEAVGADKDVGRLDVAVDDALGVRVRECVRERGAKCRRFGGRERSLAQQLIEARTVNELHDEVRHVAVDAALVELDQAGVREASQRLRFLGEALRVLAVRRPDDLDRDVGAVDLVDGSKDVGHAAATQQGAESVPSV